MPKTIAFNALPDVIPVFPIEGAVLMPGARLPLNIFEPRYLTMLDDVLKSEHRLVGLVQPRQESPDSAVYTVGSVGRITSFSETDDGRYTVVLSGQTRFKIIEEVEGFTPYRRMRVDWHAFRSDMGSQSSFHLSEEERAAFLSLLQQYFAAAQLSADWESLSDADEETLVNAIAMLCPFAPEEKQALLEARSLKDRHHDLTALMQMVIAAPSGSGDLQ